MRIADLGCGDGALGRLLGPAVEPGGRVDGFDADPAQIAAARAATRAAGSAGRFQVAEATSVERPDASYDRVACQALLVHLSDPSAALAEMVRLARPGGLVAVIEPLFPPIVRAPDHAPSDADVAAAAASEARLRGYGSWDVADHLVALLHAAGLVRVVAWVHPGVVSVQAGGVGGDQRLLRDLTEPATAREERLVHARLARDGGCAADRIERWVEQEERLALARRTGLRDGRWWEWRQHRHMVCVGQVVAV